jgi:hypothetical protein
MKRSFRAAAIALALALATLGGCKRRPPPTLAPLEAAPTATASAPPADHALPNEIAEGAEKAFGLPIPRRMRVVSRFDDVVFASGDVAPELVVGYVRQRVLAGHVEAGPTTTVFTGATLRSDPTHTLRVDVISRNGDTDLTVRDETRPPVRGGLTEAERWKELGLSPNGAPLDPTHLE